MRDSYDVIVIGGGHAGTEAAWAAANALAADTTGRGPEPRIALITMDPARIGQMSCNPAIGGLGKGQMVREIDALGGLMGRAIDATGIMFKMLNTSKGAAVRGPRAQADKYAYAAEVQRLIATHPMIDVIAGTIDDIIVEAGAVVGVGLPSGAGLVRAQASEVERNLTRSARAEPIFAEQPESKCCATAAVMLRANAVVLTTGTFMRGLMHTGEHRTPGGRVHEAAAQGISSTLRLLGFELGRLKTGTPPRLTRESIDWDGLAAQVGDAEPVPFSDLTWSQHGNRSVQNSFPCMPQVECRMTHTTAAAHELIRANLHRAPMYAGQIDAETGPRYCPSIEDKVVRFAERTSHHVFLEPESLHTNEIYANGISTSLPIDVQEQIVHQMPGCAHAEILRWGYAVEYDMVWPHQIDSTTMTRRVRGLFLAGQINCTTGYEEAGAQGLIAGLNAARLVQEQDLVRLGRDQAYIGVMLDDLVTRTPREPYRMFTSRAEHRLLLRAENADERLTPLGRELGLVDDQRWHAHQARQVMLEEIRGRFSSARVQGRTLREHARRPEVSLDDVRDLLANHGEPSMSVLDQRWLAHLVERVIIEARYDGYISRQAAEIKRQQQAELRRIPEWVQYEQIDGLRREAAEMLQRHRPATIGQASRLAGVNPADLTLLAVIIRRGPVQLAG